MYKRVVETALIIAITDIHSKTSLARRFCREVEDYRVDTLVIAGDITHFHSVDKAIEILGFLSKCFSNILFIPGNCDPRELLGIRDLYENIHNIHCRLYSIGNYLFYGIGGSNKTPFNTLIEYSEDELESMLPEITSDDNIVLVTHAPPYNTLDKVFLGFRVGVRVYRKFLEKHSNSVKLWITGHIHEARGLCRVYDTLIVNPGAFKDRYYALIDLDNMAVEIKRF